MHTIDLSRFAIRTDLIIEDENKKDYTTTEKTVGNIKIEKTLSNTKNDHYTTISFDDVTDKDNYKKVEEVFIEELKPYINEVNIKREEPILVVGLGNSNSTPDSLGPEAIKQVLVTRYLFSLGDVDENYHNVASIAPEVTSTTGIETSETIKSLITTIDAKLLIVIDALAASSITRVNKTIQITNTGIHPGSGVGNNRKELSQATLNIPVIAIGVPTIVDAATIVYDTFKYLEKQFSYKLKNYNSPHLKLVPLSNQDYSKEKSDLSLPVKKEILGELGLLNDQELKQLIYEVLSPINYNLMVTPTEIDFLVEKLGLLIGNGINKTIHKHFNPTNN